MAEHIVAGARLRAVLDIARRVAGARLPVVLLGETGTGKEVLARFLHEESPRRAAPLVCVNCGAIPAQLIESTLFGYERGAFTGASQQQKGVFEVADGGTVFLDEIGELSLEAQAALLRVLEAQRFTRVGSTREISVDVRVVAATHRDLERMCTEGSFRQDLYYRLSTVTLTIPPLRERREDIAPFAHHFLRQAASVDPRLPSSIDPGAMSRIEAYAWPGNVRELRNVIDLAAIVAQDGVIREHDLPPRVREATAFDGADDTGETTPPPPRSRGGGTLRAQLADREREIVLEALQATRWNRTRTAQQLGLPVRTLSHKLKAMGIKRPDR
jgi:DNA-binding NtrC family response regulator